MDSIITAILSYTDGPISIVLILVIYMQQRYIARLAKAFQELTTDLLRVVGESSANNAELSTLLKEYLKRLRS